MLAGGDLGLEVDGVLLVVAVWLTVQLVEHAGDWHCQSNNSYVVADVIRCIQLMVMVVKLQTDTFSIQAQSKAHAGN